MRKTLWVLIIVLLALVPTSGSIAQDGNDNPDQFQFCLHFEALTLGDRYVVGDQFAVTGANVKVWEFEWSTGERTGEGQATVEDGGRAGGWGYEIATNNINLMFEFKKPLRGLVLLYGDYGGNVNLSINDEFVNVQDFDELDGAAVGGVKVSVKPLNDEQGALLMVGDIISVSIGGQELWIDDACRPEPEVPITEEVIEGSTEDRGGEVKPNPDLPLKGDNVPPIDRPEEGKPPAVDVRPSDREQLIDQYGDEAKGQPEDRRGSRRGRKQGETPPPVSGEYGRLAFTITPDTITLSDFMVIEGSLVPMETISGELLFVVFRDEQPVFLGTFPDPLVAIGFPEGDEGHSYETLPEGSFMISIPGELLDRELLASSRIVFYRLDPAIPFTTPVTVENFPKLVETSEPIAEIDGDTLLRAISSVETGE